MVFNVFHNKFLASNFTYLMVYKQLISVSWQFEIVFC